jgi:phytoene dehydrogenase-like protein
VTDWDVVIVGGGHNGLVAACYLATAGRSVLVLERSDHVGGAAISRAVFPGFDARLSKYSYLLSLFPTSVIEELRLPIRTIRRRVSSYTPDPADPTLGLLVRADDRRGLRDQLRRLTGSDADADAWERFAGWTGALARAVAPGLTGPVPTRAEIRERTADDTAWTALIETPLGEVLDREFDSDLVRGILATDGLIGTATSLYDQSLLANRCLLFHTVGNSTGDWDVPVGGMGAVTDALADRARAAGAQLRTGATVTGLIPGDGSVPGAEVHVETAGATSVLTARHVLVNAAPQVLDELVTGRRGAPGGPADEGSQLKVNLLLSRLPRPADAGVDPADAFAGTFHINETQSQLERAFTDSAAGGIPAPLPAEIYCHTLSDPSILSPALAARGVHTMTLFGLHVPYSLFIADPDGVRDRATAAALASVDRVLAEPIAGCLLTDAAGRPCIDVATPVDLERDLALPQGNIFHTPVEWPWAEPDDPRGRWGVGTAYRDVLLCGSGALRGGAVSGIPGRSAAMALLAP